MYSFIYTAPEKNITAQATSFDEFNALVDDLEQFEDEQELDFN
ncbi:hypothetical protein HYP58_gp94 [Vibrio phage 1.097.O._10N.286.49.B3]|uniref:Coil containing protein n=1 Tax=Vibrio phage 1.097.O._10N.286.49.B3 TaxID=1881383 RepID=A0A2I7R0R7_9CAUD|nr:hypothetical protein HYP58_gp94 [Vibrio phage 1.097.O._10N.286.49.B3]AUR87240.1 hypothetical protein NVP1097O_94 [Vibrio phage 1.097.O._10N.286.49.B3]